MLENNRLFVWDVDALKAFEELRSRLATAPILIYPDFNVPLILDTDASHTGIGAVLSQTGKDQLEHPIAYYSRTLNKHERNYYITRLELLAAVDGIEHFRCYLYGSQFVLRTEHSAIQWLRNFKEPTGQLARWLERLAAYNFILQLRPGRKHLNADALSRKTAIEAVLAITDNKDDTIDMKAEQCKDKFLGRVLLWSVENSRPSMEDISTLDYEEKLL